HERRRLHPAPEDPEILRQLLSQDDPTSARPSCPAPAAWVIRRDRQYHRHPGQTLPPIEELLLQGLALQPAPLPGGKVGVLQRQRRQGSFDTPPARVV